MRSTKVLQPGCIEIDLEPCAQLEEALAAAFGHYRQPTSFWETLLGRPGPLTWYTGWINNNRYTVWVDGTAELVEQVREFLTGPEYGGTVSYIGRSQLKHESTGCEVVIPVTRIGGRGQ